VRRAKQMAAATKMIKRMMKKKKKGKVGKWTLQVEKSPRRRPSSVLVLIVFVVTRTY
jgi:hypothetical protein